MHFLVGGKESIFFLKFVKVLFVVWRKSTNFVELYLARTLESLCEKEIFIDAWYVLFANIWYSGDVVEIVFIKIGIENAETYCHIINRTVKD